MRPAALSLSHHAMFPVLLVAVAVYEEFVTFTAFRFHVPHESEDLVTFIAFYVPYDSVVLVTFIASMFHESEDFVTSIALRLCTIRIRRTAQVRIQYLISAVVATFL